MYNYVMLHYSYTYQTVLDISLWINKYWWYDDNDAEVKVPENWKFESFVKHRYLWLVCNTLI